jgi:hypothetical protein
MEYRPHHEWQWHQLMHRWPFDRSWLLRVTMLAQTVTSNTNMLDDNDMIGVEITIHVITHPGA